MDLTLFFNFYLETAATQSSSPAAGNENNVESSKPLLAATSANGK